MLIAPGLFKSVFRKILSHKSSRTQNTRSPCARPRRSEGVKGHMIKMMFHGFIEYSKDCLFIFQLHSYVKFLSSYQWNVEMPCESDPSFYIE